MPYTSIQFIAYVIDTAPQANSDGSQTYLGLVKPSLDIEARCDLMLRAMQTARDKLLQIAPPPASGTTLNVFMAPEFFFRGAAGAYQMDDVQALIRALQQIAADKQWVDWVFMFGTILGVSSSATTSPPHDADPLSTQEVYNFALVQQGGVAGQADAGARVVMKELMSGIDFIADATDPDSLLLGNVEHLPASTSGPGRERQRVNYDGAGVFDLLGITWALDVCLDHAGTEQRLQRSPQLPGENLVQLQLVPSCGMDIQASSVICEPGGYVFNCDGLGTTRHSSLAQQASPAVDVAISASVPVSADPIQLQSTSPVEAVPINSLYADGPGVINLYPARSVPPAATVPGSTVRLVWQASPDYSFIFQLVYDASGQFVTAMCEIQSGKTNFRGNNYFLPLQLQTRDSADQQVSIEMEQCAGTSGYAGAVWCRITVPGFIFEGNAFQFSARASGLPPDTVW